MSQEPRYVEVAVPIPVDHTFTYSLPEGPRPAPGSRVLVPFRRGARVGFVVGPGDPEGIDGIRPILDVLELRVNGVTYFDPATRAADIVKEKGDRKTGEVVKITISSSA